MNALTRLRSLNVIGAERGVWGVSRGLWEMVFTMGDIHQTCLSAQGDDQIERESGPAGVREQNCMMRQEGRGGRTRGRE